MRQGNRTAMNLQLVGLTRHGQGHGRGRASHAWRVVGHGRWATESAGRININSLVNGSTPSHHAKHPPVRRVGHKC